MIKKIQIEKAYLQQILGEIQRKIKKTKKQKNPFKYMHRHECELVIFIMPMNFETNNLKYIILESYL